MGKLADALIAAEAGDMGPLLLAVRSLPSRTGPDVDPQGDDTPDPIEGESFDDVTLARMLGRLTADQYAQAIAAASTPVNHPATEGVSTFKPYPHRP